MSETCQLTVQFLLLFRTRERDENGDKTVAGSSSGLAGTDWENERADESKITNQNHGDKGINI